MKYIKRRNVIVFSISLLIIICIILNYYENRIFNQVRRDISNLQSLRYRYKNFKQEAQESKNILSFIENKLNKQSDSCYITLLSNKNKIYAFSFSKMDFNNEIYFAFDQKLNIISKKSMKASLIKKRLGIIPYIKEVNIPQDLDFSKID